MGGCMKYKLLSAAKQLALMLLVIWTVVSLVTFLIEIVPGDPATVILGETATQEQIENLGLSTGLTARRSFSRTAVKKVSFGTVLTIAMPITGRNCSKAI